MTEVIIACPTALPRGTRDTTSIRREIPNAGEKPGREGNSGPTSPKRANKRGEHPQIGTPPGETPRTDPQTPPGRARKMGPAATRRRRTDRGNITSNRPPSGSGEKPNPERERHRPAAQDDSRSPPYSTTRAPRVRHPHTGSSFPFPTTARPLLPTNLQAQSPLSRQKKYMPH